MNALLALLTSLQVAYRCTLFVRDTLRVSNLAPSCEYNPTLGDRKGRLLRRTALNLTSCSPVELGKRNATVLHPTRRPKRPSTIRLSSKK